MLPTAGGVGTTLAAATRDWTLFRGIHARLRTARRALARSAASNARCVCQRPEGVIGTSPATGCNALMNAREAASALAAETPGPAKSRYETNESGTTLTGNCAAMRY